jgi:hypothetical protein
MRFSDFRTFGYGLFVLCAWNGGGLTTLAAQQAAAKSDAPAAPAQAAPQASEKPNAAAAAASAQENPATASTNTPARKHVRPIDAEAPLPTRYDFLRGAYGPYRANNDLLYYHLDIRVDPEKQWVRR